MGLPRRLAWVGIVIAILGACATTTGRLPPGTPIAQVRQGWPGPNAEHALPGGGTRLEFNQGTYGKETWMLDFDAKGGLVSSTQVLTLRNLETIAPGMSAAELRVKVGRPADVISLPRQQQKVWRYRFIDGDCVWFQVSISDSSQQVAEVGTGRDPACDGPEERFR